MWRAVGSRLRQQPNEADAHMNNVHYKHKYMLYAVSVVGSGFPKTLRMSHLFINICGVAACFSYSDINPMNYSTLRNVVKNARIRALNAIVVYLLFIYLLKPITHALFRSRRSIWYYA